MPIYTLGETTVNWNAWPDQRTKRKIWRQLQCGKLLWKKPSTIMQH